MSSASATSEPVQQRRSPLPAYVVVIVGVLATTLGQAQLLGRIPIQNLLKNELHAPRALNAAFFFWIGLPWYFKPLVGIVSDAFPLFGSRRRSYMLFGALLAVFAWAVLYFTPHQYGALLTVCLIINCFMVVASTAVGGYMVEIAQASSGSGRLASVRLFVQQFSFIVTGPTAGFLGSIAFGWTAAACGFINFLLLPAAWFFLREKPVHIDSHKILTNAGQQIARMASARTMWAAAGLVGLFYLAPGLSTAVFYKQQNDLHLDTQTQGFLTFLGGVAGVAAALVYGFFCRRHNLRRMLVACLLFGTAANLGYLFYSSLSIARVVESFNGWGYTLAELALMDLVIRATPAGSEALGFSLLISVRNIALFGSDWFGSKILDLYHIPFDWLVLANGLTTFIAVPLVFLLPAIIVGKKDSEDVVEVPAGAVEAAAEA